MKWPRKGIIIRVLIYGPLLGYFGWHAWQKWRGEPEVEPEPTPESVDEKLAPHKKTITLPDGTQQDIYELTPQQAEEILGRPLPEATPANDAGAPSEQGDAASSDAEATEGASDEEPG